MCIVFRCEASTLVGFGHFSRCLSLANALSKHNTNCYFVMTEPATHIYQLIEKSNHTLLKLNVQNTENYFDNVIDANQIISLLEQQKIQPDWIIIDHYQIMEPWWIKIKVFNKKIQFMLLNDSGKQVKGIDCIWDPASSNQNDDYNTETHTLLLLGPQYTLLRPEFNPNMYQKVKRIAPPPYRILISIGATDPANTAYLLISWILELKLPIDITLLTTSANPHITQLTNAFEKQIAFEIDNQNISEIMYQQHLIITGAGNMVWEAFSLGIPCALIKTCENQQRNIQLITKKMQDIYLGKEANLNKRVVVQTLLDLLTTPNKLALLSKLAVTLCNGQGSEKVAHALINKQSI